VDDIEGLGQLLGETARSWRYALDRRLRPLGLSGARWRLLLHMSRASSELTQKELAARAGIEGPTLAVLLERMERDGWITRETPPRDRRTKTVHPTARAREVIRRIESEAADLRAQVFGDLSADELRRCMSVLRRIRDAADRDRTLREES
jgi:MarR family transcriptional regulator for hemolysin